MEELYNRNKDFKAYVDKHCALYGIDRAQAFSLMLVKMEARKYLKMEGNHDSN